MKKLLPILLAGMLLLSGCKAEPTPTEGPVPSQTAIPTETASPTTEALVETTIPPITEAPPAGTLSFNTYDITFRVKGDSWEVYNGTMPKQYVTFSSDAPTIASFENGIVTAVSPGTTQIRAEYGGETITCILRCVWDTTRDPVKAPPETFEGAAHYYDDAVFVGDSVSLKLSYYAAETGLLGSAKFLVRGSYSAAHAVNGTMLMTFQGQEMPLPDAIAATGAKKIFFMLGMNDIALHGIDKTMDHWAALLRQVREVCPDAEITIQSMTPVWTGGEKPGLTNPNIDTYNQRLKTFAGENGCTYLDVASYMKDSTGGLASAYCSDEYVHLTNSGAEAWVKVLKIHAAE